jgi:hypothetical protein
MPDLLPLGDDRPRDAWTWVYRCVNLIAVLAILYAVGWAKGEFVSKDDYKHDQEAATAQRDKVLEADQKMKPESETAPSVAPIKADAAVIQQHVQAAQSDLQKIEDKAVILGQDPGVAPANTINIIPQVTGLTGGGPTNLDGVPTANLPTYYVLAVFQPASGFWRLELDTDPISFGTVVTPLDHTNRSWRQRG